MCRRAQCYQVRSRRKYALLPLLVVVGVASPAVAEKLLPPDPAVSIGKVIPFDGFVDEEGRGVALLIPEPTGSPPRAWVVSPIYTRCLHTCSPITTSLRSALEKSGLQAADYRVVSFSFDPNETADGLRSFRTRMQLPPEWLTLRATNPTALARTLKALDFRTITIGDGMFDHPNLIAVLTPDHRLATYLFGVVFSSTQVAAAVRNAQSGVSPFAGWEAYIFAGAGIGLLVSAFVFFSLLSKRRGVEA